MKTVATVITLTPNPALDLSGDVQGLVPDEKNYVSGERRDPGGNGINASRIISRLGVPTLALGFLGGATGEELKTLLDGEKVAHRFTTISGSTRVNVTVNNQATHHQTRLTFPGPKIAASELRALLKQIRALRAPGILVLGGSMPPGLPSDFHSLAGSAAEKAGLGVVVDVPSKHLRPLLQAGRFRPLLVKPNLTELSEWAGRKLTSEARIIEAARKMAERAEWVCVSLAEKGALLVSRETIIRGKAPRIRARGTVGAGDSMVGAICATLVKNRITRPGKDSKNPLVWAEALQWGLAAGAATAEVQGTSLARASEIRRLHRCLANPEFPC